MKKIIIPFAIIMTMTAGTVCSQSIKFGIKGGTDIKKLTGVSFDKQFSYGYHLGVFTEIGLGSKFGIQPEVYFSQVNIDTVGNFSAIHNFNQISKVKFVSLQAGPQYGILIDNSKSVYQNGKDAFNKGDFSILAGFQLNINKLRLYGRYAIGLNNLNEIDDKDKWKTQTIHLGLGFTF